MMDFGDGPCLETGRISIVRYLTPSGDDQVILTQSGDAEHAVIALGMLAMASDTVLHGPDDDDDDDHDDEVDS